MVKEFRIYLDKNFTSIIEEESIILAKLFNKKQLRMFTFFTKDLQDFIEILIMKQHFKAIEIMINNDAIHRHILRKELTALLFSMDISVFSSYIKTLEIMKLNELPSTITVILDDKQHAIKKYKLLEDYIIKNCDKAQTKLPKTLTRFMIRAIQCNSEIAVLFWKNVIVKNYNIESYCTEEFIYMLDNYGTVYEDIFKNKDFAIFITKHGINLKNNGKVIKDIISNNPDYII